MKQQLKKLANRFGYTLSRVHSIAPPNGMPSLYHMTLITLLSCVDKLRIVQVGANDGAVGDPLYAFIKEFSERCEVLLIEPQESIIPHLESNYAFHSQKRIFCGAVGPKGSQRLYSIDPEFWDRLDAPYSAGWPAYRAPSGITSASREHVQEWLHRFMKDKSRLDAAIKEVIVRSEPLLEIMNEVVFEYPVDCLQVDTEGFDDVVIYNCDIRKTKPRVIYFEVSHLSVAKYTHLNAFLNEEGYSVWRGNMDAIAISNTRSR